jgi:uncharacterized protein (TIGR01777 family)
MKIVLSGAGGSIGTALHVRLIDLGYEVIRLVRSDVGPGEARWDPAGGVLDPALLEGAGAVISLNGAGIGDKRWSEERKRLIVESRTEPTRLLAETMAKLDAPPGVFLSASAIGVYGDRGNEELTEASATGDPGDDFLVEVAAAWEEAAVPAVEAGIRTVWLRTGIVLDAGGGALGRMLLPFKLGIGGRLGSGRQWWSWITLEDEVRAIIHLLDSSLDGPVNLTAPNPVKNRDFTAALGDALNRPTMLPVPKLALEAILGADVAKAIVFRSALVLPERLLSDGFEFTSPTIDAALQSLFD